MCNNMCSHCMEIDCVFNDYFNALSQEQINHIREKVHFIEKHKDNAEKCREHALIDEYMNEQIIIEQAEIALDEYKKALIEALIEE